MGHILTCSICHTPVMHDGQLIGETVDHYRYRSDGTLGDIRQVHRACAEHAGMKITAESRIANKAERDYEPVRNARLSIRPSVYHDKAGFMIVGRDTIGRSVNVFTPTRKVAEHCKAVIISGRYLTVKDFAITENYDVNCPQCQKTITRENGADQTCPLCHSALPYASNWTRATQKETTRMKKHITESVDLAPVWINFDHRAFYFGDYLISGTNKTHTEIAYNDLTWSDSVRDENYEKVKAGRWSVAGRPMRLKRNVHESLSSNEDDALSKFIGHKFERCPTCKTPLAHRNGQALPCPKCKPIKELSDNAGAGYPVNEDTHFRHACAIRWNKTRKQMEALIEAHVNGTTHKEDNAGITTEGKNGKCVTCGGKGLTLDDDGLCHQCWQAKRQSREVDELSDNAGAGLARVENRVRRHFGNVVLEMIKNT